MKKALLVLVFLVVLSSVLFAETELSGHVTAEYVFDFAPDESILSYEYGLEGSVAEFSIDFTDLSLSRKGTKKRHAEIGISVALSFNMYGGAISWASYGFNIPAAALQGAVLFHKFNIVGELWGDQYIIDLLHNEVGADWAHSKLGKYVYSIYRGDPYADEEEKRQSLDFRFPKKEAFSYVNEVYIMAPNYPGFTVNWRDWKVGSSFSGNKYSWGKSHIMVLGVISPELVSADSQFKAQVALGSYIDLSTYVDLYNGGSVKCDWTTDKLNVSFASDLNYRFSFNNGERTHSDFDADVALSAEAWIAKLNFYFATKTPLLGYQMSASPFSQTQSKINTLVSFDYYSDAKIEFDFHKLSSLSLPLVISATGRDMFVSRDSDLRTIPYERIINGIADDGVDFKPYTGFAYERYGRDLDVDVKIDSFADSSITGIKLFGHKILQTIELGAGIDFKFGDLETGAEGSYDFTKTEIYGMVYADYDTVDVSVYGMAMMFMDASAEDCFSTAEIGAIAGISSETFIDLATVGMEFRWDLYDQFATRLSSYRDFTIYCTVEF